MMEMETAKTNPVLTDIHNHAVDKFGEAAYAEALERARLRSEFASFLRQARIAANMDQKTFSKKVHITQQQLSRYEVGANSITFDRMVELLKALGLEVVIRNKEGFDLVKA